MLLGNVPHASKGGVGVCPAAQWALLIGSRIRLQRFSPVAQLLTPRLLQDKALDVACIEKLVQEGGFIGALALIDRQSPLYAGHAAYNQPWLC